MRLSLIAAFLVAGLHSALAGEIHGIPQIVDANTIYVGSTKVRFSSVDAPETDKVCLDVSGKSWSCEIATRERLAALSSNHEWTCELSGLDRYDPSLGSCTVSGDNVSRWLVHNGWAVPGGRFYDRLSMQPSSACRWFCTEAEAAGCRKSML
jgi:endonuclease YncB( thermonuclease family)